MLLVKSPNHIRGKAQHLHSAYLEAKATYLSHYLAHVNVSIRLHEGKGSLFLLHETLLCHCVTEFGYLVHFAVDCELVAYKQLVL
jgi:hypothetical protein